MITQEGKITFNEEGKPLYQYFLKDHIGNTRAVIDQEGHLAQTSSYYPFGMQTEALCYTSNTHQQNKYLYNGKEVQNDFDLDWYDYGARFYDAQIGRWHVVDPMASEFPWQSPFMSFDGNPINKIDPTGMSSDWFQNGISGDVYYNSDMHKGDEGTGAMKGNGWQHLGENGMFSKGTPMSSDAGLMTKYSNLISKGNINFEKSEVSAYFKGGNAGKFMNSQGYDLLPTQQTVFESESSPYFPMSPGKGITIISGEVTRITEKSSYIKNDNMEIGKTQIDDPLSKYNVLSLSKVSRYEINYTDNAWKKFTTRAINFSKSMSGTHDYRMKRTYKNWNQYPGNNSLINKFKKEYGTK